MNILNKLTIKHLTMNKKRTIVTIVGIILSTALMVGIGLLFSSLREYAIKEVIAGNGRYHSYIDKVDSNKLDIIANNQNIEDYFYQELLGIVLTNGNTLSIEVKSVDKSYFNEITLVDGKIPSNSNEIVVSEHLKINNNNYNIGEKVILTYGQLAEKEAKIINPQTKEYLIVGVVKDDPYEILSDYALSTFDDNVEGNIGVFVVYHNIKDTHKNTEQLIKALDMSVSNVDYNTSLLALNGNSGDRGYDQMVMKQMTLILALVAAGCIIVIYNAFAISVMERKKQFGLFSSVGATRKQIRKTVFFEAIIVGTIGIILGILGAYLGIGIVLKILNYLMGDVFEFGFGLAVYPLYVIIPIIFMIIVVLISAYLPARRASKVSPITAIRQNDDINIKGKKLKTNRLIKRLFGVEGELAVKNIKRNKKKYRITIASLFISIVLFITFSALLLYGLTGSQDYLGTYSFDAIIEVNDADNKDINNKVIEATKLVDVEKYVKFRMIDIPIKKISNDLLTDKMIEITKNNGINNIDDLYVINIDDQAYHDYLQQLGLTNEQPVFLNTYKAVRYEESGRKLYDLNVLKGNNITFEVCDLKEEYVKGNYDNIDITNKCTYLISNVFVTTKTYFGFDSLNDFPYVILVNDETFKYIYDHYEYNQHTMDPNRSVETAEYAVLFKTSNLDKLDKIGDSLSNLDGASYTNVSKAMQLQNNIILSLKILFYGFISLVTLIGVTSVFNTINTSIALRRKEFAMLRSVGLTPLGFNKILYLESFFFGLKSLLYALPVSIALSYLIFKNIGDVVYSDHFILPWMAIIIAVVSVFIIILITMLYASRKIKKENILDAIREENI